jgi:hypothetical protein
MKPTDFELVIAGYDRSSSPTKTSSKWVELEGRSTLGGFRRMVEIDAIDDANEPDTERDAPG